jgi:two-component system, OmpR family, sensor histidine kinase SaeS
LSRSTTQSPPGDMQPGSEDRSWFGSPFSRFVLFVVVSFAVAVGVYAGLAAPSSRDLGLLTLVLFVSALLSILVGYLVHRLSWFRRSPGILWTLLGGYVLVGVLTLLGVLAAALLMFINLEDVRLVAVLLVFGAGMAISLGYLLALGMSSETNRLVAATDRVAEGRFDVRIEPRGRDEIAALARAFNDMTQALAEAADKQHALEQMRLDLVAWAGHDLRTPLASVMVIVEALADGVVTDPQTVERYLETAKRDLRVLSLLIDDLSFLARIDAGGLDLDRQAGSLGDLLDEVGESFALRAEQNRLRLVVETEEGLQVSTFDALQIRRALTNLVDNAVRHAGAGGEVRVQARSRDRGVLVEVWNDGPSIDPKDLPHVFDRFYRSDESRTRATGGAGLGLSIAKAIVEAHGGTISVKSEPGQGTTFAVSLPRSTAPASLEPAE